MQVSVSDTLDHAIDGRRRGKYDRVEAMCSDIVARHPSHAEALNLPRDAAIDHRGHGPIDGRGAR